MKIALIILIMIHAIIHLFGFFKAYGISEFNGISQPVSKTYGLFWLLTFVLFVATLILIFVHSDYWWLSGLMALIASQVLIFSYWTDAKFGTIANIIILLAIIIGYSSFSFRNKIKEERINLFKNAQLKNREIVTEKELTDLPPIIQKWLIESGVIGRPFISNVHLLQELQLKLKPEQTDWSSGIAEQYFTIQPPAFNWNIKTEMNSILSVVGRDKFEDGKGEMVIKLLALFPVANAKNEKKLNQAALQRYLAEIVWFPSAALSPYIHWESIDSSSVRAMMEFKGTKGSGVFHFDENGQFKKYVTMRYKDINDSEPAEWIVTATKIEKRNGIKIPTECEVGWILDSKQWTWLKLCVKHIEYNVEKMPVANIKNSAIGR